MTDTIQNLTYDDFGHIIGNNRSGTAADMSYAYDNLHGWTKQISSVSDAVDENLDYEGAFDFVDGDDKDQEYAYNGNGALTMDLNKGIQNIEYDLLGNPRKITLTNNRSIEYVYSADGRRLRTIHREKKQVYNLSDSTDYVGNLILKNGKPQMYLFSGGYYSFDGNKKPECHYYVQDYQGPRSNKEGLIILREKTNIYVRGNRIVVNADKDSIEQTTHYYPYGGIIGNLSSNQEAQKYKYSGKALAAIEKIDNLWREREALAEGQEE